MPSDGESAKLGAWPPSPWSTGAASRGGDTNTRDSNTRNLLNVVLCQALFQTLCMYITLFKPQTTLPARYDYYSHFTDEETEAQRGLSDFPLRSWG